MSKEACPAREGGVVYLNERQSKEAAECIIYAMKELRKDMEESSFAMHRQRCAENIAELAKSLKAIKPIFWSEEGVEEE